MRISTFQWIILKLNWGIKYNYNIKSQTTAWLNIVRKDCQFAQWTLSQTSIVDTTSLHRPSCWKVNLLTRLFTRVSLSAPETLGCLRRVVRYEAEAVGSMIWCEAHWKEIYLQKSSVYVCSCVLKGSKTSSGQQSSNCAIYCGDSFFQHLNIVFNWIDFPPFITELVKWLLSWEHVLLIEIHHLQTIYSPSTVR